MDNFIWIGDQLVNLASVIKFTIEDEGARVIVLLNAPDPKDVRFTVDGDAAVKLMGVLSEVKLGKDTPGHHYDMTAAQIALAAIPLDVDMDAREEEFGGVAEILNPNARG